MATGSGSGSRVAIRGLSDWYLAYVLVGGICILLVRIYHILHPAWPAIRSAFRRWAAGGGM